MIYSAERIFDGMQWRKAAIRTKGGFCVAWEESGRADRRFDGCSIVPAFVDIQVYGAGGRLFSAYPDTASLKLLAEECLRGGTAQCQPTVATNTLEIMHRCIDAVRQYWNEGGEGIAGLHLEGPWINAARRGAHVPECIHMPGVAEVKALLEYGRGIIRTITLAPEQCSDEVLSLLRNEGIILSAGHSDVDYKGAIEAFDKRGISTVTHLYNAMSPLHHRAPGLVGACFDHPGIFASIIPDGIHVDFAALRIACRQMRGRLFAITDAATPTAEGPYRHELEPGGFYTSGGTLSGSALSMFDAFRNLLLYGKVEEEEALQMCSAYPSKVIGLERYGYIGPGSAACFLVLDESGRLAEVISEPGSRSHSACGVHTSGTTRS
jgi:N-acetylglucosamine-6-phosphate deacetylase